MSATKARKLQPYKDFTHYLNIPIVTPFSRPQLQASCAHFERETASIIPKGSVLNAEIFNLPQGRLRLKSDERVHACSKHLRRLDLRQMLRDAAMAATGGPPNFGDLPYIGNAPAFGVATTVDCSPLKVDVSGIFSLDDPAHTRTLKASVIDRTHRLPHSQYILLNSLFKAGFLANAFDCAIIIIQTAVPTQWGYKGIYDRKTRRWYYPGRPVAPTIDARDLIRRWKVHEWATDIQLEQIGVYALGSREKLPGGGARQKRMTEVDSIALPQAHDMNNPAELQRRLSG